MPGPELSAMASLPPAMAADPSTSLERDLLNLHQALLTDLVLPVIPMAEPLMLAAPSGDLAKDRSKSARQKLKPSPNTDTTVVMEVTVRNYNFK